MNSSLDCDPLPLSAACEFQDAASERAFQDDQLAKNQAQLRITLSASAFVYLLFGLADLTRLDFAAAAYVSVVGRVVVALCAMAGLLWLRRQPHSVPATRRLACGFELVALLSFMLVCATRPDEMQWHAMALVIVLLVIYIYIPNRLHYSLLLALAGSAAFVGLASRLGRLSATELLTAATLLLLANLFGAVAARRYERLWREDFQKQIMLTNLAVRDALTGCFNRRHLHDQLLENELARARRYRLSLSVIMCDIDHFKRVNDTYGHAGGDLVLRHFGQLLRASTRNLIDSVVRYGGEEFLMVLPETDLNGGVLVAERMRAAFAASAVLDDKGRSIAATASFGVAGVDFAHCQQAVTQQSIIGHADELLYAAKHDGRNLVRSLQLP